MSEAQTQAPVVLTKEEKIAKIDAQIAKLQARRDDIVNDRITVAVKKVAFMPEVGQRVIGPVGRNSATTQAKLVEGTVVAIKPATIVDGKTVSAAQVRIRVFEGSFEEQLITLYPAQLTPVQADEGEEGEGAAE